MGIGGLHSCEKAQYLEAGDGLLCDWDVASYYPSIILEQQLAPAAMGKDFLELYQSIVTRRLEAKAKMTSIEEEINKLEKEEIIAKIAELKKQHSRYKTEADSGKVQVNGSFGKMGSKYSPLYAPALLLQTTITGQLCLLMLIERMEAAGIRIKSANTDGVVCQCSKAQERDMELVAWNWMLKTSYALERTDYRMIASRDVNNYFAVKTNGKVKRKGVFKNGGLMKNVDRPIVHTAVIDFLKDGVQIEDTINNCADPSQFVSIRKVTGGAKWDGEEIGKAIRYYASTEALFIDPCIHYVLNGNKVSKSTGCRPLMEMGDTVPSDLNYQAYIDEAQKLLREVGYGK